jgi:hypothetical protein
MCFYSGAFSTNAKELHMEATTSINHPGISDLAKLVHCLDELAFATLAGVKVSTLDAWRKRGKGPDYVLLGRNYLYPITAVQAYIGKCVRQRTGINPNEQLA